MARELPLLQQKTLEQEVCTGRHDHLVPLWNPSDLGYLSAYATKALVNGTVTGGNFDF